MKTFLQSPYFDDYDENKNFHKVLVRPSIPLQAREFNTIQSIFQDQIKRFGDNIYVNGTRVKDGQLTIDTSVTYVKLQDLTDTNSDDFSELIGQYVTGQTSGVTAEVMAISEKELNSDGETEPATLIVRYVTGSNGAEDEDNAANEFIAGETLISSTKLTNLSSGTTFYIENSSTALGTSSIASINSGIFYIYGYFVRASEQTIILEKYSSMPAYNIGIIYDESIVTPEDDSSLYDNALGSSNYTAPGAHRYKINLTLTKFAIHGSTPDNFIKLATTENGETEKVDDTTEYQQLLTIGTLEQRTYDESGDYTVRPFKLSLYEHRSNNCGLWERGKEYISGDIIKNKYGTVYEVKRGGTSSTEPTITSEGLLEETSSETSTGNGVVYEVITNPVFNDGVYPYEGCLINPVINKEVSGITGKPVINVTGSQTNDNAELSAIVTNGTLSAVKIDYAGTGYIKENGASKVNITFNGDSDVISAECNAGEEDKFVVSLDAGKCYVLGHAIETTVPKNITVEKARTVSRNKISAHIIPSNGNYVLVSDVSGIPPIETFNTVELWNSISGSSYGEKIGTARIRDIRFQENENTYNSVTISIYRLYLFDICINSGWSFGNVKSIRYSPSSSSSIDSSNFSANITPSKIPNSTDALITGATASSQTITGVNTAFTNLVEYGNTAHVLIGDDPRAVAVQINSNTKMTIIAGARTTYSGSVYKQSSALFGTSSQANIYKTDKSYVNNIYFDTGLSFVFKDILTGNSNSSGTTVTVNITTDSDSFATAEENFYTIFTGSNVVSVSNVTISNNGKTATLTLNSTISSSSSVKVLCPIQSTITNSTTDNTSNPYTKSLMICNNGNYEEYERSIFDNSKLVLNKADGESLIFVKMGDSEGDSIDVTSNFEFYSGRTDIICGNAYIKLKSGYSLPAGSNVYVKYRYFEHSSDARMFTKTSYSEATFDRMRELPIDGNYNLRDSVDFRPTIDGKSKAYPRPLLDLSAIQFKYDYYLGRKDRVCVDNTGKFFVDQGEPDDDPSLPEIKSGSMNLYNITLSPYTEEVNSKYITIETIDNKRYTMRDIGRLENRISRLEYYTSLSLLEQQTASMQITDADGNDRFSNGFVVDNFTTSNLVNENDENLSCSIDTSNNICRPSYTENSVSLTIDTSGNNTDFLISGKLVTLPRNDDVLLISQEFATKVCNVNPYAVATFNGKIELNPSTDDWYETEYTDDEIVNVEGNYSSLLALNGLTTWNDWQTTWAGEQKTVSSTTTEKKSTYLETKHSYASYQVEYETNSIYAQNVEQTRTGTQLNVSSTIDMEEVGDKLVSTTQLKYMRSRYILVKASGLKPYTQFYPFFDGVDVSYWCTPCSAIKFEYTSNSSKKFTATEMANLSEEENITASKFTIKNAREIDTAQNSLFDDKTDKTCLDIGDVVYQESGSQAISAVVCGVSYTNMTADETTGNYLYVANIKRTYEDDSDNIVTEPCAGQGYNSSGAKTSESLTTFTANSVITGTISGATGTVISAEPNMNHIYDGIYTNGAGELYFLFWIPQGEYIDYSSLSDSSAVSAFYFKCGERVMGLSENNSVYEAKAEATYSATGVLNTRQKTVNAVRNAVVTSTTLTETQSTQVLSSTTSNHSEIKKVYVDPLAETFVIDQEGGCFLSKVVLYFAAKDETLPVTVQIRPVDNGYPSDSTVLAFAEVSLLPEKVNISSNYVTYTNDDGLSVSYPTNDIGTEFAFSSPVYVEDGVEYAIVVITNSTKYELWTARMGDVIPNTGTVISKQPYNGVLFKSQNGSTWSADQNEDLMFEIYRCDFDTSASGLVNFVNAELKPRALGANAFETKEGSSYIKVNYVGHGLAVNDNVTFEYSNPNLINGYEKLSGDQFKISETTLNCSYTGRSKFNSEVFVGDVLEYSEDGDSENYQTLGTIETIESDSVLTLKTSSVTSGTFTDIIIKHRIGGIDVLSNKITRTVVWADPVSFIFSNGSESAVTSGITGNQYWRLYSNYEFNIIEPLINYQSFSNTSVGTTLTAYERGTNTPTLSATSIAINANNNIAEPLLVNGLSGADKTLKLGVHMSSSSSLLTPVIDTERVSTILINNIINSGNDTTYDNFDFTYYTVTSYKFTKSTGINNEHVAVITTSDSISMSTGYSINFTYNNKKSENLIITGITSTKSGTNMVYTVNLKGDISNSSVLNASTISGTVIQISNKIVSEISNDSNIIISKYITKEISLNESSTLLNITFAYNCPIGSNISVYYKTYVDDNYDATNWTCADDYLTGGTDDEVGELTQTEIGSSSFYDATYSIENLESFNKCALKICFTSTNSSAVPCISQLRVIACE